MPHWTMKDKAGKHLATVQAYSLREALSFARTHAERSGFSPEWTLTDSLGLVSLPPVPKSYPIAKTDRAVPTLVMLRGVPLFLANNVQVAGEAVELLNLGSTVRVAVGGTLPNLSAENERLRAALRDVRDRIQNPEYGGIDDTFWMSPTETVVDFIDGILAPVLTASNGGPPPGGYPETPPEDAPANCSVRLREAGGGYPKSGCEAGCPIGIYKGCAWGHRKA